jgi:chromosome segregation ATPase
MNNIRLLTGGLVLIVLGLAGGTGYLIYERIQSEVTPAEKATKQDIDSIRHEQAQLKTEYKKDYKELKESDHVQSMKIKDLEDDVAVLEVKDKKKAEQIKKLQEDGKATKEDIAALKAEQNSIQDKLKSQNEELDKAKKEREAIRKQLAAQGRRIDDQEKRIDDLEKKVDDSDKQKEQEIAELRAELAELKRQLGLGEPEPSN